MVDVNYSPNTFDRIPHISPLYLCWFLFSGLYDKGYKQAQLIRSTTTIAALCILSDMDFFQLDPVSRGILVLGISIGLLVHVHLLRQLFIRVRLLESQMMKKTKAADHQGSWRNGFRRINNLMHTAGMRERIGAGWEYGWRNERNKVGDVEQLLNWIGRYGVRGSDFCADGMKLKDIIQSYQSLAPR